MMFRIWSMIFSLFLLFSPGVFAAEEVVVEPVVQVIAPAEGSWTFSGMVTNESGDRYGYFFQMQKHGSDFHAKTALIDGETNKLVVFFEGTEKIDNANALNWKVGRSFMRYNPINDSWVFGVKDENHKGFNFKVDMLEGNANSKQETLILRPGVELQALQTSHLNGHIQIGTDSKEQFVTGNNAWLGKLWLSKDQKAAHDISTTFCRLNNDHGFYSANLKESDATGAAVAGWRDEKGNKVKMSQFLTIKSIAKDQCLLSLGLPKLNLKVINTLQQDDKAPRSVAGFSQEKKGFCFVTEQSFVQFKDEGKAG